jgi:excisionase family DNA binding protein
LLQGGTVNELLSTGQAAELLGVDRTTVWRWWRTGELRAQNTRRTGHGVAPLFDRSYIELYAKSKRAAANL